METVKEWFGKGCKYLSAQWENNDTPNDSEPVLQFCNHKDNPEDTEGNCRHNICPLLVAVFDESMGTEVDLSNLTIRGVGITSFIGVCFMGKESANTFWRITCPCGVEVVYPVNQLPEIDTLNPCGKPNHWTVKYEPTPP